MIADALARLRVAADDGQLEAVCRRLDVVLMTVFGSAVRDVETARDPDVAALFGVRATTAPLELIEELVRITGTEDVDLMVLDDADPVARSTATAGALPLYADGPVRWGTTQMAYEGMLDDTEGLAASLGAAADMRDLLIHDYARVDLALVAAAAPRVRADASAVVRQVSPWLVDQA